MAGARFALRHASEGRPRNWVAELGVWGTSIACQSHRKTTLHTVPRTASSGRFVGGTPAGARPFRGWLIPRVPYSLASVVQYTNQQYEAPIQHQEPIKNHGAGGNMERSAAGGGRRCRHRPHLTVTRTPHTLTQGQNTRLMYTVKHLRRAAQSHACERGACGGRVAGR